MMPHEARSVATLLFGLSVLIVVTLGLLQSIPLSLAAMLAFWTVMSVPFGIAIGHCIMTDSYTSRLNR
jgi:hypothetical protein